MLESISICMKFWVVVRGGKDQLRVKVNWFVRKRVTILIIIWTEKVLCMGHLNVPFFWRRWLFRIKKWWEWNKKANINWNLGSSGGWANTLYLPSRTQDLIFFDNMPTSCKEIIKQWKRLDEFRIFFLSASSSCGTDLIRFASFNFPSPPLFWRRMNTGINQIFYSFTWWLLS